MSDHDAGPDPIDKAYVQAEVVLGDGQARAARRARVLAAVAQEPTSQPAPSSGRRPGWQPGRWLAAASVAGLGVLIAAHLYAPVVRQPQIAPAAVPVAPTAAAPTPVGSRAAPRTVPTPPALSAVAVSPTSPAPKAAASAPTADLPAPPPPPPPLPILPAPRPPPPPPIAPAPEAFPAAAASAQPPAPPPMSGIVVTAERRTRQAVTAFAPPTAAVPSDLLDGKPSDRADDLRAAAGAGRAAEVEALLQQGVPVDAPDANGETALMKSIRGGHSALAALLRRHGASLDRRNHAGQSARDMATARDDASLNQALGLAPSGSTP